MNFRRPTILIAILAVVAGACSGTTSEGALVAETPTSVTVTSGTGNVNVTAADSGADVTAEISASGEAPVWTAELVDGVLVVDDGCGDRSDCSVDLDITVAGTADVTINSTDGGITVVDMNSRITIAGTATNVVLNGITGPIDVDLTSGDLLAARLVSTDASFHTGKGDLDVTLTETFTSLTVTSEVGNVTAQVPGGQYNLEATASGEVEIDGDVEDVDGASSSIVMRSADGDVTVYRR